MKMRSGKIQAVVERYFSRNSPEGLGFEFNNNNDVDVDSDELLNQDKVGTHLGRGRKEHCAWGRRRKIGK